MTPKVPSDPMKSCLRSYPVLSFRRVDKQSNTCPSANTCMCYRFENKLYFFWGGGRVSKVQHSPIPDPTQSRVGTHTAAAGDHLHWLLHCRQFGNCLLPQDPVALYSLSPRGRKTSSPRHNLPDRSEHLRGKQSDLWEFSAQVTINQKHICQVFVSLWRQSWILLN